MSTLPRKQEADLSKDYEALEPKVEALLSENKTDEALNALLALEKQSRNAADLSTTSKILIKIISTLFSIQDYKSLNEQLSALSKKHGQIRQATVNMVDEAMSYLDKVEGQTKLDLISTLREVTEGKIYLEVQRARITRMLAHIKEHQDKDIIAASDLFTELQVDTFGSMERREKVDFILEEMRLLRLKEDWDKLNIVSKSINIKWLAEEANQDLKLRFYGLMIQFALHANKHLDVCKYYRAVFDTPSIQADQLKWMAALRNAVFFVILAPYDNEQFDLLSRLAKEEKLVKMPQVLALIKCFTTPELMRWPGIQELYGEQLRKTKVFGPKGTQPIDAGDIEEEEKLAQGDKRWEELHMRVVEHNVRTISTYYTQITLQRLSELLDLSISETEEVLARLTANGKDKMIYAKIDRPAKEVSFVQPKSVEQTLNEWSSDLSKLMGLIDKTCHLIAKEHAIANAKAAAAARA